MHKRRTPTRPRISADLILIQSLSGKLPPCTNYSNAALRRPDGVDDGTCSNMDPERSVTITTTIPTVKTGEAIGMNSHDSRAFICLPRCDI